MTRDRTTHNRPGLSQLSYRIGDYHSFRQRLLAALPQALKTVEREAPLAKLTTRDSSDPAIALLDAWAVVADVLTFYQERIANEGFLRTATERRSVLELARAIAYELDPGVAASTYLSFVVEDAPGSPTVVPIPAYTQIMSVPVKDELPQIFETTADFTARLAWNNLRPRPARPQQVLPHTRQLYLEGASTQLQPGELLLLVDRGPDPQAFLLPLQAVEPDTSAGYTRVRWHQSLPPITAPLRRPQVLAFRQQARLFGFNAPPWEQMPAAIKLAAVGKRGGAIAGGVFRSDSDGLTWTAASQGLPDSDILCMAVRDNLLLAGTPDKGIFRSSDNGQTWEAANEGLINLNVLALHIAAKDSVFNEAIFAGTPNGGVFRSKDQGQNWVAINQGNVRSRRVSDDEDENEDEDEDEWEAINTSLPTTVVRSLATYTSTTSGSGTISGEGVEIQGEDTAFTSQLFEGEAITVSGQSRTVTSINSDTSIIINEPFQLPSLLPGTSFSARSVIRYSHGIGPVQINDQITDTISSGTISSIDNTVQGTDTNFLRLTQGIPESIRTLANLTITSREITITANDQEQSVVNILADDSLTISAPFTRSLLDSGTLFSLPQIFIFVGTDEGVYRSDDLGRNWLPKGLGGRAILSLNHIGENNVMAGTDVGIFYSSNDGESWSIALDFKRKISSITSYADEGKILIFAGTDAGVFRSLDGGENWEPINTVQTSDLGGELESLADSQVRSLATYRRGDTRYLFAATNDGVFVSTNSSDGVDEVTWQRISQELAIQDTTTLAIDGADETSSNLYLGAKFGDFLSPTDAAGTEPVASAVAANLNPPNWPNFVIQEPRQLDLDTLYPQWLEGSWVVLVDDRNPSNPEQRAEPRYEVRQINAIATVDRQDFGLAGKLTRLEFNQALDPQAFGLRSARLLGRSTDLPLALEPLTVEERQHEIFADPLVEDTLYLQDFVADLQPKQVVMVSGQPMGMVLSDVGGVLRSRYPWQPLNDGLNDLTINAMVTSVDDNLLLAATNDGLYSLAVSPQAAVEETSPDNSAESIEKTTWAPLPGLRFKTVHSIFSKATLFLVGADLELYRASNPQENLVKVNIPIEATVLTFLAGDLERSGTAETTSITSISGITLKLSESFPALDIGTVMTVAGQTRIITEVKSSVPGSPTDEADNEGPPGPQTVLINRVFEQEDLAPLTFELGGSLLMAGTDRGILRSTDDGQTWEYLKPLRDRRVYCLLARVSESSLEIYAGTDQGLHLSSDSGQSWSRLETLWDQQTHPEIYALAQSGPATEIWIGTGQGLYRYPLADDLPPEKLEGLCDRAILSLTIDDGILYAGTDQGIYCSQLDERINTDQTWDALDPGLAPATGRVLLPLPHSPLRLRYSCGVASRTGQATPHLLVGTEAGLFATPTAGQRLQPTNWSRSNTGLVNSQVTTLASSADGTTLLAGTLAGLYRSASGGRTWAPFDDGLDQPNGPDRLPIQAILRTEGGHWLVGTPAGLFVHGPVADDPDGGTAWQLVGRDTLTYPNILALALQGSWLLAGTENGGLFKLNLTSLDFDGPQGQLIAQRWQPTGLNNTDVDAIAVADDRIYAGTVGDGIFYSRDRGNTWEHITQTRQGRGTLTSDGTQVSWNGTRFDGLLRSGDVITAAGQTRTITGSIVPHPSDPLGPDLPRATRVVFTVDTPFRPDLSPNTRFTIDTGLTNLEITALAYQPQQGAAGNDVGPPILYAGTAGSGVFRSKDGGDRWQPVIANLDDLNIRCLLWEASDEDGGEEGGTLWAGTATRGVFRSINQGDLWTSASLNLTNTDVCALLRPSQSTLLVGGIGCLHSPDGLTVKPVQRHDRVQVVQAPQPIAAQPDTYTYQRWQLRDKDGFLGTLDTTAEQIFPLLPAEEDAPLVSEQARIKHPPTEQQQPVVILQEPLTYSYDPATVTVAANVVPATHGETAIEVLGSGDGTTSNPTFALKKPPLTYVAATNARGSDSTLEVRVDGVLWQEVSALYSLQPQAQAYIIRIQDDGTTTVTFGDGVRGSRPPSGQENITARYRSGIGREANVQAGQLSILKTRPQGIAEVINPLAASGAADRESLDAARTNAPPTARTLGRIVSLQDFQDFAQGFVGIAKAQAVALWDGSAPVVHITIAGADGAPVPDTSALYQSLLAAIDQARDPTQQVQVASYQRLFFNVEARVLLDTRYQVEAVEPQLEQVLLDRFAFQGRGFGQAVTSAEVITALQAVEGVIAVDLAALYQVGRSRALNASLRARTAVYDPNTETIQPAQLFLLSPVGLQFSVVSTL